MSLDVARQIVYDNRATIMTVSNKGRATIRIVQNTNRATIKIGHSINRVTIRIVSSKGIHCKYSLDKGSALVLLLT